MNIRSILMGCVVICSLVSSSWVQARPVQRSSAELMRKFRVGKGLYQRGSKARKVVTPKSGASLGGLTMVRHTASDVMAQGSLPEGARERALPTVHELPGGRLLLVRWIPSIRTADLAINGTTSSRIERWSPPQVEVLGVIAGGRKGSLLQRPTPQGSETTTVYPVHPAMKGLVESALRDSVNGQGHDPKRLSVTFEQ